MKFMSLVWKKASLDDNYTFECPLTGNPIHIYEYTQVYGPFMKTLDGSDMVSYVDFFFQPGPVYNFHWEFRDQDARDDFIDLCQEMGLMKDMKDICEGNWDQNEINKYLNKPCVAKPKPKPKPTKPKPQEQKPKPAALEEKIRASRLASIEKLERQIVRETEHAKIERLQAKLDKIRLQLKNTPTT